MENTQRDREEKRFKNIVFGFKTVIRILIVVCIIVLIIFLARKAYAIGYEAAVNEPVATEEFGEDVNIVITDEMSIGDIGEHLIAKGLINESKEAFLLQEFLSEYHDKEIPGTYTLNTSMTVDQMLKVLAGEADPEEETEGTE